MLFHIHQLHQLILRLYLKKIVNFLVLGYALIIILIMLFYGYTLKKRCYHEK